MINYIIKTFIFAEIYYLNKKKIADRLYFLFIYYAFLLPPFLVFYIIIIIFRF